MIKTPCNIVTGFLGTGKTTLLKNVMERGLQGRRVAIVMNEIGDIGIDGQVFTELDGVEKMVELNSGCVCCTINQLSFQMAFQEIQEQVKPDLIIVETTGLADPFPIINRLRSVRVSLDAVITLVDTANFLNLAAQEPVLNEQVKAADFLVMNKLDLVEQPEINQVEQHLQHLNQRALLFKTVHASLAPDLLFSPSVSQYRNQAALQSEPMARPSSDAHHHHGEDEIQVFSYQTDRLINIRDFEQFLVALPSNVYRAKGFLTIADRETAYLFNFTCGRFEFQSVSHLAGKLVSTQAVFIGRDIQRDKLEIIQRFQACEYENPNYVPTGCSNKD